MEFVAIMFLILTLLAGIATYIATHPPDDGDHEEDHHGAERTV